VCDSLVFSLEFRVGLQKNDPTMNLITILKTNKQLIASYCQDPKKQSLCDWINHIVVTTEIFHKKSDYGF